MFTYTTILTGGPRSLLNKCCWENWTFICRSMKLDPYLTPSRKSTQSELNVRPETVQLLEENIMVNLQNIGFNNDFLDMTSKAQARKTKIDHWDYIKLKIFCITKETTNKIKRQPT